MSMVPQMVAKITIGNYPMASGDCKVASIAKLVKVGGVWLVGNGRLMKRVLYYTVP